MATLCEAYSSPEAARRAVDALRHVGIPERDIRLLIGSSYHDVRSERAGGFALPVDPDAPFGKYSGPPRLRRQAAGGFAGVPDRQRQGSFGDVDRNVSVTYDDGFERSHMARDSGVAGWLRESGPPDRRRGRPPARRTAPRSRGAPRRGSRARRSRRQSSTAEHG